MTRSGAARRVWAIVPAAGRGERFEPGAADARRAPKQYSPLLDTCVLEWSLRPLLHEARIEKVVVVVAPNDSRWDGLCASIGSPKLLTAIGGASRQDSVISGLARLKTLAAPDDWILVHDAARPCLDLLDLRALISALEEGGPGAVLACPIVDTVKRERDGVAVETAERQGLWRALTPQVFGFAALSRALANAAHAGINVTDESQGMERLGVRPRLVHGSAFNIKITRAADLTAAARILMSAESLTMRIGQGFDVHAFGDGDHVVLGGVRIAYGRGVVAHSDGDVAIHALCDAVLGALGQGDIGRHFSDTDPRYRGADSRLFLRTVAEMMRAAGFKLVNADITVLAEAPRIAAHRAAIESNLASDLGVGPACVNVKATTTERMGFIGRGEGLAALAVALLDRA